MRSVLKRDFPEMKGLQNSTRYPYRTFENKWRYNDPFIAVQREECAVQILHAHSHFVMAAKLANEDTVYILDSLNRQLLFFCLIGFYLSTNYIRRHINTIQGLYTQFSANKYTILVRKCQL